MEKDDKYTNNFLKTNQKEFKNPENNFNNSNYNFHPQNFNPQQQQMMQYNQPQMNIPYNYPPNFGYNPYNFYPPPFYPYYNQYNNEKYKSERSNKDFENENRKFNYSIEKDSVNSSKRQTFQKAFFKNYKVDLFKNKSSDQIVNEFKSFTLPKLRLKRLIKLQAVMKGFYVRRFLIPRKRVLNSLYEDYIDKKIRSFLEVSIFFIIQKN